QPSGFGRAARLNSDPLRRAPRCNGFSASRGRLKYFRTCGPRMTAVVVAVLTRARLNPLKILIGGPSCRIDFVSLSGQLSTGDGHERRLGRRAPWILHSRSSEL